MPCGHTLGNSCFWNPTISPVVRQWAPVDSSLNTDRLIMELAIQRKPHLKLLLISHEFTGVTWCSECKYAQFLTAFIKELCRHKLRKRSVYCHASTQRGLNYWWLGSEMTLTQGIRLMFHTDAPNFFRLGAPTHHFAMQVQINVFLHSKCNTFIFFFWLADYQVLRCDRLKCLVALWSLVET